MNRISRAVLSALLAVTLLSGIGVAQTTWFVDQDATGTSNGTSWNNAFTDLRLALLTVTTDGDELRIAEGVYKPDLGTLARASTFGVAGDVALRGGYAGVGAPNPNLRDFVLHTTVLSGDLLGDDGPGFANRSDNSYHVVTAPYVLDGLTIRSGNADGLGSGQQSGGGISQLAGTMLDCIITDNQALDDGGGASTKSGPGSADIQRCAFSANSVGPTSGLGINEEWGGGLFINAGSVADTLFADNLGVDGPFGQAYGVGARGGAAFTDCEFRDNIGQGNTWGIGLFLSGQLGLVQDSTFTGNTSGDPLSKGGALAMSGLGPRAANCTLSGNSVPLGKGGGAYNGTLDDCLLVNNTAAEGGGAAGGVLRGCRLTGNNAIRGGGAAVYQSIATIVQCTISANSASDVAGGIYDGSVGSGVVAHSSILWSNTAGSAATVEEAQVSNFWGTPLTVRYSCIQGWPSTVLGVGNIGDDPLFIDQDGPDNLLGTADDDLQLLAGSPCINGGDPMPQYNDSDGTRADMGALPTTQPSPPPTWVDLGFGLAGSSGVPMLGSDSNLLPFTTVDVVISGGNPLWVYQLVLGTTPIFAGFKLGTFVPNPDLIVTLVTDPTGTATVGGTWPPGVPSGFSIYAQCWAQDPGGPVGWAASNALRGNSP